MTERNEILKKVEELKDTDACPQDDVSNLINWNECTNCGKQFTPKDEHGYATEDGFICKDCLKKWKKVKRKSIFEG